MIVLDTNVLSALMQTTPDAAVIQWLNTQPAQSIWTTSITVFEIYSGIAAKPAGRRRQELELLADQLIENKLENRILEFDNSAARAAASLKEQRRRAGINTDVRDTLIAGIVLSRRATFATRNIRDFDDINGPVVNPWTAK